MKRKKQTHQVPVLEQYTRLYLKEFKLDKLFININADLTEQQLEDLKNICRENAFQRYLEYLQQLEE